MREIKITKAEEGQRLNKILEKYLNLAPKSFCYKMLRKKNIVLNAKKADGSEKVKDGDVIKLFLAEETIEKFTKKQTVIDTNVSLEVLYEDSAFLIVNKPVGMLSQKAKLEDISLVEHSISYLLKTKQITEASLQISRPSICNRLDRNTSGIVVLGKHPAALQAMGALIVDRSLKKYYLCIVAGKFLNKEKIAGYLRKEEEKNKVQITMEPCEDGKYIETEFMPIAYGENTTLLEVYLITGRTHQIRAHLSAQGYPIIGDTKYGDLKINKQYFQNHQLKTQLLHARRLVFPKLDGLTAGLSESEILAPLPKKFKQIIEHDFSETEVI